MNPDKSKEQRIRELRAKLDKMQGGSKRPKEADLPPGLAQLRRALERKPRRPAVDKPRVLDPIVYHRDLPHTDSAARYTPADGPPVSLEDALDGEEVSLAHAGRAYCVTTNASEIDGGEQVSEQFKKDLQNGSFAHRLEKLGNLDNLTTAEIIFMDLETTGLSNSPLFLAGVMTWENHGFQVRQYLARNYAEEAAAISLFLRDCESRRLLVTFNGKSFDVPFVRTRAAATAVPCNLALPHLDLLHESRRVWREELPNCKLQTLETQICGRPRHGDIPGSQIPDAYHAFVHTGNAYQIVEILKHNMLDLVTLADIMTHFPADTPK